MKIILYSIISITFMLPSLTFAQNKVAVIPLGENSPRIYYATIGADGIPTSGNLDLTALRPATGRYLVRFNELVIGCSVKVTRHLDIGFTKVVVPVNDIGGNGNDRRITVQTFNDDPVNQDPKDAAFHFMAFCP